MFQVDVLSAYLNCGVSALAAAAILRLAETDDPRLQQALRMSIWGMVTIGVGLVGAGFPAFVPTALGQGALTLGSVSGITLFAGGLSRMQGRGIAPAWTGALVAGQAAFLLWAAQSAGMLGLGRAYAVCLALSTAVLSASTWGFVARPRNFVERAFGLALFVLMVTSVLRLVFTLSYSGEPRADLIYLPGLVASLLAVQYAVMPILAATLLLGLVNARLQQQLRLRASTDELTGVLTRRALRELAPPLIDEARRRGREVAVLILDLDHFKTVNDRLGHATGDRVLETTAAILRDHLRPDSLLARYGGEEFVALIPTDDLPGARRASERLRGSIEAVDWSRHGLDWRMTVSIGVALVGPQETLEATLMRADEALYRSKRDGRNQVQVSLMVA